MLVRPPSLGVSGALNFWWLGVPFGAPRDPLWVPRESQGCPEGPPKDLIFSAGHKIGQREAKAGPQRSTGKLVYLILTPFSGHSKGERDGTGVDPVPFPGPKPVPLYR